MTYIIEQYDGIESKFIGPFDDLKAADALCSELQEADIAFEFDYCVLPVKAPKEEKMFYRLWITDKGESPRFSLEHPRKSYLEERGKEWILLNFIQSYFITEHKVN